MSLALGLNRLARGLAGGLGGAGGGAPSGPVLIFSDDFSSDTSGLWSRGPGNNDGVLSVSGGQLVSTGGASDGPSTRWNMLFTDLTVGKTASLTYSATKGTATQVDMLLMHSDRSNAVFDFEGVDIVLSLVIPANGQILVEFEIYDGGGVAGLTGFLDQMLLEEIPTT